LVSRVEEGGKVVLFVCGSSGWERGGRGVGYGSGGGGVRRRRGRPRDRSSSRWSVKDVRHLIDDDNGAVVDVRQSFELIADGSELFSAGDKPSRIVLVSCSEWGGDGVDNDEFDGEWRLSRGNATAWYWCIVVWWGGRDFLGEGGGLQSFDVGWHEEGE
jgi:hypothetical protein